MNVLIVDPDVTFRDYVSMVVEMAVDGETIEVSSGNEALSIFFAEEQIDLIISEVEMKGGNGDKLTDYLKENKLSIPILWLSSASKKLTPFVKETLDKGSALFMQKPFKDDEFFSTIEKVLALEVTEESGGSEKPASWEEEVSAEEHGADWSVKPKGQSHSEEEAEADWSLKAERKASGGDEESADWSLKKEGSGDIEEEESADWSLKSEGSAGSEEEESADWSLKKEGSAASEDGESADWSLKPEGSQDSSEEESADWSIKSSDPHSTERENDGLNNDHEGHGEESATSVKGSDKDGRKTTQEKESSKSKLEFNPLKEGYAKVRTDRFFHFNTVPGDIYIRLSAKKYVKLVNQEDLYDIDFLQKYKDKGVKYLFMKAEVYPEFQKYFSRFIAKKFRPPSEKSDGGQLEAYDYLIEQAAAIGINESTVSLAKETIDHGISLLKKDHELGNLLAKMMNNQGYLVEHSLMVSYVCCQIALKTNWNTESTLQKLCMASMFHDIVLEEDEADFESGDMEVINTLPKERREKILSHPKRAAEIVVQAKGLYPDLDSIISQHHELPDGSGYPQGVGAARIAPMSCIFIMAQDFVSRLYGLNFSKEATAEVVQEFKDKYKLGNFKKPLEGFLKAFE